MSGPVAGLLLAAGEGRRLGMPKGLVRFGGEALVERGARVLTEGGCDPVLVVVGAQAAEVEAELRTTATVVRNPEWRSGMGSSLRAGLRAVPEDVPAVVVTLADQPGVTPAAVRRLANAWARGAKAAVATYDGEPRNPVLLDRSLWEGVAEAAAGDVGARAFLRARPGLAAHVPCDDVADPWDVDTADDLAEVRRTEPRPE
jgi:CTP:molybdopterin cytidylyltransferase MocA